MEPRSPCLTCERKDLSKDKCAGICDRLDAFQRGNDYEDVPIPTAEEPGEGGRVAEDPKPKGDAMPAKKLCAIDETHGPAKCRGLCLKCYEDWRHGRIVHPTEGAFVVIHRRSPRKKAPPKSPAKQIRDGRASVVETMPGSVIAIDLGRYPAIRDRVFRISTRFLLTPEHVVINLLSVALRATPDEPI